MKYLRNFLVTGFALVIAVACVQQIDGAGGRVQAARHVPVSFVDEAPNDVSFHTWRAVFTVAVAARDLATVKEMTALKIALELGSSSPRSVLIADLTGPNAELLWQALERSNAVGGVFVHGNRFVTTGFDDNWSDVDWDLGATYFAGGVPQPVFAQSSEAAPVLTSLQNVGFEATRWSEGPFVEIRLADGRLGYLRRANLHGIGDYRATFDRINGNWLMTGFVPGL